ENSTTQIFTSTDFISETTAFVESETTTNSIIESTTRNEESTTMETTTRSEEDTTIKTTTRNEESTTIEMTARSEENTTIETTTTSLQSTTTDFTSNTVENSTTRSPLTTTSGYENEKVVCTTGECKNVASKMLFYMNHTVDPCDDFYEYACGGFEANQQTVDLDLENAAYERILQQTQARIHKGDTSPFISYYLSCVQYENVILSERIRLARKALNNVGRFYTTDNFDRDRVNFTELVAKLLLHNSALLFDVSPALNEYVPKQFTLKIGPTTYRDPFETEETDDACYASRNKIDQEKVDLTALYKEYKTCKINWTKLIYMLTKKNVLIDATVQVYFYNDLYKGLQNLQEFEARDPMQFNNALLGLWTHYAMPFQSKGLAIYGLDLVVIPFGAIDWSTKYDARLYDYRKFATLGNTIAHQIAHHFDHRGIYYKSGVINNVSILHDNSDADTIFHDYVECQRYDIYGHSLMMTLPSTGQTVYYKISSLSLNVRLSETMGLVLAYDTLDRLRSRKEVHLPWLNLDSDQLFYLTYAQMHCTKSPLTTSYVSLYEDEQLPSRIRIFLSASNNRLLGEAWNCPKGSEISPSYSCGVFPFL
ncbi:Endothelin-converting enzyme 1, partial [Dufourea novaeangliae]